MPAAMRTATMTTSTELLRLLAWLSPAFPTGGFAYSHGIEWAVEAGDIRDGATLRAWIEDVLRHGAGQTDAILLRHAHAGNDVTALAVAAQPGRERRAEATGQGEAFVRAAAAGGTFLTVLSQRERGFPLCLRERAGVRASRMRSLSAASPASTASALTQPARPTCRRSPQT